MKKEGEEEERKKKKKGEKQNPRLCTVTETMSWHGTHWGPAGPEAAMSGM